VDRIKVVLVDDSVETRKNIKELLSFERCFEVIGEAGNGEDAIFLINESKPDVVMMDINMPVMDGIKATEYLSTSMPATSVIIMSVHGEHEYLRQAMAAGAREYLIKPFTADELYTAILKSCEFEAKRRKSLNPHETQEAVKTQVISVFSTKGGVGKTTIASNLAVTLSRVCRKKIALIDLDLQFGDIAIMLNVSVKNTISDYIKEIGQSDNVPLDDYLVTHFSGIKVLPAPIKPEYAEFITSKHIEKIIEELSGSYHYIIIDASAGFHETVLTSLDISDRILFISTLDLPTIKNVKSGLDIMDSLKYPESKVKIVVNKASEQYGVKYKDFEATLKRPIWAYIPEDSQTVITSANKGFPFVMTRTETKVAKAIINLAKMLVSEQVGVKTESVGSIRKLSVR